MKKVVKKEENKRDKKVPMRTLEEQEARINESLTNIKRAQINRKVEYEKATHRVIYWSALVVLLVCNFVISVILVPFILVMSGLRFYLLVILFALIFGWLFNLIINDIEHIESKHHLFAIIILPVVGLINILITTNVSNYLAKMLMLPNYTNPTLPATLYAIVFLLPYIYSVVNGKKETDNVA